MEHLTSSRPWGMGWLSGRTQSQLPKKSAGKVVAGLKSQGGGVGTNGMKRPPFVHTLCQEAATINARQIYSSICSANWVRSELRWTAGWSASRPGAWGSDCTHHYLTWPAPSLSANMCETGDKADFLASLQKLNMTT